MYQFAGSDFDAVLGSCEQLGLEGVVVMRQQSAVTGRGRRSPDWRKLKCPAWRTVHAERRVNN